MLALACYRIILHATPLDPGRKSQEKQKIIDSAVDNYHKQKMIMPEDQEAPSTLADLTGKLQKCDILEVAFIQKVQMNQIIFLNYK